MSEKLVTFRLFSPLTAGFYAEDERGDVSEYPEKLTPAELCQHEEKILKAIRREKLNDEGERGLAVYLHEEALEAKIYSMNPSVESWQGELWGVLEVQSYGELTELELKKLTEEWCGQASDGWGEGFEQRPIKTEEGELYVSFWNGGRDFFIMPEQKLKQSGMGFGMQMGGM